jgi:uncharacterized protein (TIGR04255 family)
MTARPSDLPDFEAPPVAEVVLGVKFTIPGGLKVYHIGIYWDRIKSKFPKFQEQPPLPAQDEPAFSFVSGPPPLPRCWFLDDTETRLIQLQADRFIHNWRKVTGEEKYPRYEAIRDEFVARWDEFCGFLVDQGGSKPILNACELAYVNHISKESCWTEPKDLGRLFSFLATDMSGGAGHTLESVQCGLRFKLPGGNGHLNVSMTPAIRKQDQQEILRFDLSARGAMESGEEAQLLKWFDGARETIVRVFTALTTEEAHSSWKRKT